VAGKVLRGVLAAEGEVFAIRQVLHGLNHGPHRYPLFSGDQDILICRRS
jgi:hypothetical protein